jgi:hypothetical protein
VILEEAAEDWQRHHTYWYTLYRNQIKTTTITTVINMPSKLLQRLAYTYKTAAAAAVHHRHIIITTTFPTRNHPVRNANVNPSPSFPIPRPRLRQFSNTNNPPLRKLSSKNLPPRPKPPPEDEIEESFLKGSGPGGQKIVRRFFFLPVALLCFFPSFPAIPIYVQPKPPTLFW